MYFTTDLSSRILSLTAGTSEKLVLDLTPLQQESGDGHISLVALAGRKLI